MLFIQTGEFWSASHLAHTVFKMKRFVANVLSRSSSKQVSFGWRLISPIFMFSKL